MNRSITVIIAGGLFVAACGEPAHLQHTWSQSYTEAFGTQADLERESVAYFQTELTGEEALALRERVAEATTDAETGEKTQD